LQQRFEHMHCIRSVGRTREELGKILHSCVVCTHCNFVRGLNHCKRSRNQGQYIVFAVQPLDQPLASLSFDNKPVLPRVIVPTHHTRITCLKQKSFACVLSCNVACTRGQVREHGSECAPDADPSLTHATLKILVYRFVPLLGLGIR
jgi:hypothetical protein